MSYQSGGYQSGSRSRRQGYEDLGGGNGEARPMQTMEILSGKEYGHEFDESSGPALVNRWFVYGCVAFLLLIIVVATHPVDDDNNTNFKLPKNGNTAETTTTNSTTTIAPSTTAQPETEWEVTSAPLVEDGETPTEFYDDICNVPNTYVQDSDNFTYLNADFCLPEVGALFECGELEIEY